MISTKFMLALGTTGFSAMTFAGLAHAIEPGATAAAPTELANGTLVIIHDTDPDDATLFTYMVDGQTPGGAGLDDAPGPPDGYDNVINNKTFSVLPGDYTISQGDPGQGWSLEAIKCNGPTPAFANLANRSITLNVAPGTKITCRFYNKRAVPPASRSITIRKQVDPDNAQDFNFNGFGPSGFNRNFTLDDDAMAGNSPTPNYITFANLPAGTYSFKELLSQNPGWSLAAVDCALTSPTTTWAANLADSSVQINLGQLTQSVSCTFTNRQATAEIRIIKDATPNSNQDFSFNAAGTNFNQSVTLDDDAGVLGGDNTFQNSKGYTVPAGQYALSELPATGWALTNIDCSPNGSPMANPAAGRVKITAAAGQIVTCTFRNKQSAPPPCTGYPYNAPVTFNGPGWGPTTVHICRGGTVTFSKTTIFSSGFSVAPSTPAGSFVPVVLGSGNSSGSTLPFQTPGTYKYSWSAATPQGTIIVHP